MRRLAQPVCDHGVEAAQVFLFGHTHRPGMWRRADGRRVINTGSFCRPLGGLAVDIRGDRVLLRRIEAHGGEFRLGAAAGAFNLGRG